MLSNFVLIIGAMKSGTTTLYDYLAQHPEIAASHRKEVGFFAFEEKWALGFDWFERQFDLSSSRHSYGLEASTDYTKHPFCTDVVQRIRASKPRQFKLIYIMRHPLRRIESHARHTARTKKEVGQCLSPIPDHSLDCGISPVSLATSKYAHQLDQFKEFYSSGQVRLLTLEELSARPASVLKEICEFIGIDKKFGFRVDSTSNRARGIIYIHPTWTALSRIGLLNRLVKTIVPADVRNSIRQKARMEAPLNGRFRLSQAEETALLAQLAPDLVRLRDEYGVDIESQWGIRL